MTPAEIDTLIGQLVHDLRTPLSAIAGYAEMLEQEIDPATQRRFAANIRRAAAEMEERLTWVRQMTRQRTESEQLPGGGV
jgi:signal transduction histidine kinase